MKKSLLLYHIIYIGFFSAAFGQELHLKIKAETEVGNHILDSIPYKKKHADFLSLKTEVDSVYNLIQRKGFLESKLSGIEKNNDSLLTAFFILGNRYKSLRVNYKDEHINLQLFKQLNLKVQNGYFEIPINKTETTLNKINNTIAEQGFPFATVKLINIKGVNKETLIADLEIDLKGGKRHIDNIVVKGYEKFPKSFLKYFLKLKSSQQFSLETIKKKTALLDNLRFADQIKEPEVLFTNDSTSLYLYLEKSKSNSFDGFLGFGTNEDTNNIEFDGYLNLELNNNLNYGESFRLLYKSDENKQKTFNAFLDLPYLFHSPLGAQLQLNIFKRDTIFTTVNQTAGFYYQLNPKHRFIAGIESIESNDLTDGTSFQTIADYKTLLYTVGYEFQNRNQNRSLFPIKSLIKTEIGLGNRTYEGNNQNQTKLTLDAWKIFSLNDKNSVFLRMNGSGLDSDTYFENELVRFGGINSIRGFEENSLFASWYGLANTEYRYTLSPSIYIHSITDFAYMENKITNQKEKLYGFGFGFGILTQAGLFKLVYANGKSENQSFKLSNSKVHISLSAFF